MISGIVRCSPSTCPSDPIYEPAAMAYPDTKGLAPLCFHGASTGGSNANAAPEGGA